MHPHQLLLLGAENRHQILDILIYSDIVGIGNGLGQHLRQHHHRRTLATMQVVEGAACHPPHPGFLLFGGNVHAQLVKVKPEGDGDLLHQVAATLIVASRTHPAQTIGRCRFNKFVYLSCRSIYQYNTHLLSKI